MPGLALADQRTRTVILGKTTRITVSRSWNKDCGITGAVVKVKVKPQHGKLTHKIVETTVPMNRTGTTNQCFG